ncbi:MAG: methyl-accepting chemotaxis protein [Sodalinema sp.]|uniref:methyl-accepting chemotaxis protein n=1 Tax=Sodalinema sp. TaxID=3080550 RepID=UPI00121A36FB|nr:MAG: methyl-accepting chemotaxis protein [Phormidium sp. SL48-SHIP]
MAQPYSDLNPKLEQDTVSSTHSLDLLDLLLKANQYEQNGESDRARELYQQIIEQDEEGVWGQSARKALGETPPSEELADTQFGENNPIPQSLLATPAPTQPSPAPAPSRRKRRKFPLGVKLKLMAIAAAFIPLGTAALASFWLLPDPQTGPRSPRPSSSEDVPLDRQLEEQLERAQPSPDHPYLWIALLATGSAVISLSLILPRLHRWGRELEEIADYSEQVNQENPLARLDISPSDNEIGGIVQQLREMIDRLTYQGERLGQLERQRDREHYQQQQEKQRLQQQAMDVLERLEAARRGNLTVQAPLSDGAIGAIADAFNATTASLRRSLSQTNQISDRIEEESRNSHLAAHQLCQGVDDQSQQLQTALTQVTAISQAMTQLSQRQQDIRTLAQQISQTALGGSEERSEAVSSIDSLRTTVANSSKKAKRLAESAQEVSQILTVVVGISERANLLAFNAAIEAARAGERGAGFRQVADDVRGLAVQISESTADIERLINGIQQETAEVLDVLEAGTSEVVNSTRCVQQTQTTLRQVIDLSQDIETTLAASPEKHGPPLEDTEPLPPQIEDIYDQSLRTVQETRQMLAHLQQLTQDIEILRSNLAKFQLE